MGAVDTTYTFTATDTITSAKMNNIIDETTITTDAIIGTTLDVVSGKLKIRSQGITSNEISVDAVTANALASNAVTTAKILDANVTTAKILDANVTTAKILDANVTTAKIADAAITAPKLNGAQTGTAPIYGARAWVSFNGTTAGTFAGGGSTVTRVAGSTLCTVTTASPHGMVTNNRVYAATGVVAGTYTITKLTDTTFTFNTAATTALTSASITFLVRSINGAGNVNSVAYAAVGLYWVNMTIPLSSSNYSVSWGGSTDGVSGSTYANVSDIISKVDASFSIAYRPTSEPNPGTGTGVANQPIVDLVVFQ